MRLPTKTRAIRAWTTGAVMGLVREARILTCTYGESEEGPLRVRQDKRRGQWQRS